MADKTISGYYFVFEFNVLNFIENAVNLERLVSIRLQIKTFFTKPGTYM